MQNLGILNSAVHIVIFHRLKEMILSRY